jgi:tetratricopeptide (TPR) repeat protein
VDPDDRRLKFYRGVLLVLQGKNPAEAEMDLKSYLSTVPDNYDVPPHAVALEWLGKLYESLKRYSESAEEYKKSLALDPRNKDVQDAYRRVQRK